MVIAAADTVAEEDDRGGKGPVSKHRKGSARLKEEAPDGWPLRRTEEAALLRKAFGEKKEEADGGAEAKAEAPQTIEAIRFGAEAGETVAVTLFSEQPRLKLTECSDRNGAEHWRAAGWPLIRPALVKALLSSYISF